MSEPIRYIKDRVWIFDTEYIPCPDTIRRVYNLPIDIDDIEVVRYAYQQAGATEENPQPMLKGVLYKVISIAGVSRTWEKEGAKAVLWSGPNLKAGEAYNEKTLIETFMQKIGKAKPQLVGFASNMFDLTLLFQRAIILGCNVSEFCRRPAKPWDDYPDYFGKFNDYNIDLSQVLGGVRWLNPKLSEIALACRIPGKIGADGSKVYQMWLENRHQEIIDYNECDALTTYMLWLSIVRTCGHITDEDVFEEQLRLMTMLEEKMVRPDGTLVEHYAEFYWQWHSLNMMDPNIKRAPIDTVLESAEPVDIKEEVKAENEVVAPPRPNAENPNVSKSLGNMITSKQLNMVRAIAREKELDAEAECGKIFACRIEELSKRGASDLIDALQNLPSTPMP